MNTYCTPQTSSALSSAPDVISSPLVTSVPQDMMLYPDSPVLVEMSPFPSSMVVPAAIVATDDGSDDVFYEQDD